MLFSTEMMAPTGPPPQGVLDQSWLWKSLMLLLGFTFVLRLIGLDIAGSLLTGLMLCIGVIMLRDGMREMGKYALVYAVLCGLNFFFDILPLITELGGRVTRTKEPVGATSDKDGIQQTTYTLTTKVTPFFDPTQGLVYNVQSLAVIMSPLCMALGIYLSVSAHNEIHRSAPQLLEQDFGSFSSGPAVGPGQQQAMPPQQPPTIPADAGPGHRLWGNEPVPGAGLGAGVGGGIGGANSGSETGRSSQTSRSQDGIGRFQGKGYKLG